MLFNIIAFFICRRLPNLVELVTNVLLITSVFMLTHTAGLQSKLKVNITLDEMLSFKSIKDKEVPLSQANITSQQRIYPLFVLDLLYGWPIDPRNTYVPENLAFYTPQNTTINKTLKLGDTLNHTYQDDLDTTIWYYIIAFVGVLALSLSLQLAIRSTANKITEVVFFQGFGILVYALAGKYNIGPRCNH